MNRPHMREFALYPSFQFGDFLLSRDNKGLEDLQWPVWSEADYLRT